VVATGLSRKKSGHAQKKNRVCGLTRGLVVKREVHDKQDVEGEHEADDQQ